MRLFHLVYLFILPFCLSIAQTPSDRAANSIKGLPLTRSYTFQEIGDVSPGLTLSTDPLGRLLAIQEGACIVFDDKNWTDLLDSDTGAPNMTQLVLAPDGKRMYFGSSGNWGYLEYLPNGKVTTHSMHSKDAPGWSANTAFNYILFVEESIVLGGDNGVILHQLSTGQQSYHHVPDVSSIFAIKDKVFVCSYVEGTQILDTKRGSLENSKAFRPPPIFWRTLQNGMLIE